MTTPRYERIILEVGDIAPDFTLPAYPDDSVTLSRFRGHSSVILAFYVDDTGPSSLTEIRNFSNNADRFAQYNCSILCCSFNDLASHCALAQANNIKGLFLLSDTTRDTARSYGALLGDRRSPEQILFVIDRNGKIAHKEEGLPDCEQLLDIVKSLPS
jgi:peroxiredoxin